MRYVENATVTGVTRPLSKIGLGTWQFGSREWGYGAEYEKRTGDLVRRALEVGITVFDTAEIYGTGQSERLLGAALNDVPADQRHRAFIASKLFPILPIPRVARDRATKSARRLGVPQIDLYQVHWPNPVIRDGTIMPGLRSLLAEGLIGHVGVSNYSAARWRAAEEALGRPVLSNQVSYSLARTTPETEVLPYAAGRGRLVIAYSPIAQGLFSGRYDAAHPPTGSVRTRNPLFLPENLERAARLIDLVKQVAEAHDATPTQIALAYVIHRPEVIAIPGASSVEQIESNAAAADIELTSDEYTALADEAQRFTPIPLRRAIPKVIAAGRR